MKRTTMLAAVAGAALVLGFGGTAVAAGLSDDSGSATSGLGAAATPSAPPTTGGPVTPRSTPSSATPSSSASSASASSAPAPVAGGPVSRERAVAIARAYLGFGTVREVESDDVHDVPTWKVEFTTGDGRREIDVEKATGRVINDELDDRGGRDSDDDHGGRHGDDD
ncbi:MULTISPECIES: PepSY domain-containing protein [Catenuloplanes]|uniref:PepSY domain-containing protein n=1 Tax=Catenuloplanes niger TaxID=587534 RepID=A0AAE3ZVX9_9ACTN|nr:PepSY domain-containing protein [Catenuloplanes niger]MDR7326169.1 hypothetical protein [Catenuloplanes niger]